MTHRALFAQPRTTSPSPPLPLTIPIPLLLFLISNAPHHAPASHPYGHPCSTPPSPKVKPHSHWQLMSCSDPTPLSWCLPAGQPISWGCKAGCWPVPWLLLPPLLLLPDLCWAASDRQHAHASALHSTCRGVGDTEEAGVWCTSGSTSGTAAGKHIQAATRAASTRRWAGQKAGLLWHWAVPCHWLPWQRCAQPCS